MSNTADGQVTISPDLEDAIMKVLPPAIAEFLRYDAVFNYCPAEVFKMWREGDTPQYILQCLRAHQRRLTEETWCWRHPQAQYV